MIARRSMVVAWFGVTMLAVGASRAAAETRSPYLAPLRLVLERVLELRGDDLPPKAKATLEKCLTAVADEGEGLENQLKVLAKVAALWERFPGEVARPSSGTPSWGSPPRSRRPPPRWRMSS